MKYVVLKNSRSVLCIQLPEGFGSKLEIVCLENQAEYEEFLKENPMALCQVSLPQPIEDMENKETLPACDGLFIRQNEYFKKILFSEIMWIEASRSYCYIHTSVHAKIIITFPMSEIKKKLPPELFIQTHRSFIVNLKYVNKFVGNMLYIDNQAFPISRKFKQEVLRHFLFLDNIKLTTENESNSFGNEMPPFGKNMGDKKENDVNL